MIGTQRSVHILHSLSLWKVDERDAVAAAGHLHGVSLFFTKYTTPRVTETLVSHRDDNLPLKKNLLVFSISCLISRPGSAQCNLCSNERPSVLA